MPIHQTLNDEQGQTYRVVKGWWLKSLTILACVQFFLLLIVAALLLDSMQNLQTEMQFTDKETQRIRAMSELTMERTRNQQWMFTQICDEQKRQNKPCLENPIWWANPDKYPLIVNDPSGAGLFEPRK